MVEEKRVAVVTGASSGIGAATAVGLHRAGFEVVLGARRVEKLKAIAEPLNARYLPLDVTDLESVQAFCRELPVAHILINNAGGALGLDTVANAKDDDWQRMYDTNVLGLMRMTRELLPKMEASGAGHVVNIGSIAGREAYPGRGGLQCREVRGQCHYQSDAPGTCRQADSHYRSGSRHGGNGVQRSAFQRRQRTGRESVSGLEPLTPEDIADIIQYVVTRPPHVNIDEIVVKPLAQASATVSVRKTG